MKKKHAYRLGYRIGHRLASAMIAGNDLYSDIEHLIDDCLPAVVALRVDNKKAIDHYQSGVYDGILDVWNKSKEVTE